MKDEDVPELHRLVDKLAAAGALNGVAGIAGQRAHQVLAGHTPDDDAEVHAPGSLALMGLAVVLEAMSAGTSPGNLADALSRAGALFAAETDRTELTAQEGDGT